MSPALLRRRQVWVPTLWGWLALLLAGAAAAIFAARQLHPFLAQTAPAGAQLLVVEGWMEPEGFDQAIDVFRARGYAHIVTTGGPVAPWPLLPANTTYAKLAADYLTGHGLAAAQVTAIPTAQADKNHTYLSATAVREWAKRAAPGLDALDVFSSGPHARRSRLLYELAFGPRVRVGVYAASSSDYDPEAWWQTTFGVRDVVTQAAGFAWVKCCFRPAPEAQPPR